MSDSLIMFGSGGIAAAGPRAPCRHHVITTVAAGLLRFAGDASDSNAVASAVESTIWGAQMVQTNAIPRVIAAGTTGKGA
jgi:hypothetical protein